MQMMGAHDSLNKSDTTNQNSDDIEEIQDRPLFQEVEQTESEIRKAQEIIEHSTPTTLLEKTYAKELARKNAQLVQLSREISKLKIFISKRKQTYKRKRKDEGAPTRALSAYNIFIRERFSKLAKENDEALKSTNVDVHLKRVPPASLVASTGNQWKELSPEEKEVFEKKAAEDKKRYEDQMAVYQAPEKTKNKKRSRTGYNLFFTAHVERLKQTEAGVPSERGSCARIVGNAWKDLSPEDKQYYESEAEKQNARDAEDTDDEDSKGQHNHLMRKVISSKRSTTNPNEGPYNNNAGLHLQYGIGSTTPTMHQMIPSPQHANRGAPPPPHHPPHVDPQQLGFGTNQCYSHPSGNTQYPAHSPHQVMGYHVFPSQQLPSNMSNPRLHPPHFPQHGPGYL